MRILTAVFVCLFGGLGLLLNLFGFAMNGPFEPPMGVTSEEHFRRIDSGYYRMESAFTMLWLGGMRMPCTDPVSIAPVIIFGKKA